MEKDIGSSAGSRSIREYISTASGLVCSFLENGHLLVCQKVDNKNIVLSQKHIAEVIHRLDNQNKKFLQVDFEGGQKILLTEKLIGFKPCLAENFAPSLLPNVVTTADLLNIIEAIEESASDRAHPVEIEALKKIYMAVIRGGEAIGFDLSEERKWIDRLFLNPVKALG